MPSIGTNTSNPSTSENVRYTFRKHERLCSQIAIGKLIREGKTINHYPFRLIYLTNTDKSESSAQLAISVPKKNFKRAVKRNLLKRRIREAYRLNKASLYSYTKTKNISINLLLVYVSTEISTYDEIERKLVALLQRLTKRLEESANVSIDTAG